MKTSLLTVIALQILSHASAAEEAVSPSAALSARAPWPESPPVELVQREDGRFVRTRREYEIQRGHLQEFEQKFRKRIPEFDDPTSTRLATPPANLDLESWEDIDFAYYGKRALLMDVYRPRLGQDRLPAIVFVHGGGWKRGTHHDYRPAAMRMARRGYVTATVEYRLAVKRRFPRRCTA